MEPSPPMAAAPVEDLVVVDVPPYTTISGGHSIKTVAHIRQRRLIPAPTAPPLPPPRLFSYFSLRTISSLVPSDEQADFNFCRSFHLLMQEQAWEREARVMLTHVAADYGERIDLDFLTRAFCEHTSCAVRSLRSMDVVSMELSSVIIVHMDYPATIGLPSISGCDDEDDDDDDDDDDYDYDDDDYNDEDYDDDEDDDYDYYEYDDDDHGGSRPASAAAVEGLKIVTAEEPDSCSICLEDFGVAAPVLAMPCSHPFHEACLKEWLERSCSCPLCRFSLPED